MELQRRIDVADVMVSNFLADTPTTVHGLIILVLTAQAVAMEAVGLHEEGQQYRVAAEPYR